MDTGADPNKPAGTQPTLNASFFDITQSIREREFESGTADAGWICLCEDGCEYVIKDGVSKNSEPIVPHCEWFCTELSEAIQIAAPEHKIVRRIDETLVFGSRFVGGLIKGDAEAGYWYDLVKTGEIDIDNISAILSHILALDLFIFNHDRHKWNFLVQKVDSKYTIFAMDYSRAWLRTGFPLPPIPMGADLNTIAHHRDLVRIWRRQYITPAEIDHTLQKIRKISKQRVERIINDHPPDWLAESQKNAILEWWGSAEFMSRLSAISEGVRNASCL